jgi:hypothetical protein
VARWLRDNDIPFYHIPNGGKREAREAAKFKRIGVQAGIPDICIPLARSSYHGAYGELKRRSGGKVSDRQQYWLELLNKNGYYTFVGNGADEFIEMVKKYMEA